MPPFYSSQKSKELQFTNNKLLQCYTRGITHILHFPSPISLFLSSPLNNKICSIFSINGFYFPLRSCWVLIFSNLAKKNHLQHGRVRANYWDFGQWVYMLRKLVHACLLPGSCCFNLRAVWDKCSDITKSCDEESHGLEEEVEEVVVLPMGNIVASTYEEIDPNN